MSEPAIEPTPGAGDVATSLPGDKTLTLEDPVMRLILSKAMGKPPGEVRPAEFDEAKLGTLSRILLSDPQFPPLADKPLLPRPYHTPQPYKLKHYGKYGWQKRDIDVRPYVTRVSKGVKETSCHTLLLLLPKSPAENPRLTSTHLFALCSTRRHLSQAPDGSVRLVGPEEPTPLDLSLVCARWRRLISADGLHVECPVPLPRGVAAALPRIAHLRIMDEWDMMEEKELTPAEKKKWRAFNETMAAAAAAGTLHPAFTLAIARVAYTNIDRQKEGDAFRALVLRHAAQLKELNLDFSDTFALDMMISGQEEGEDGLLRPSHPALPALRTLTLTPMKPDDITPGFLSGRPALRDHLQELDVTLRG
jgi:hypothetical protein